MIMPRIKTLAPLAMVAAMAVMVPGGSQPPENGLEVIPVKYDGLKQEVLKHRGKVLVVDFWAST
jgi:hypothetical protein